MNFVRLANVSDADAIAQLTAEVQQLHNSALPELFRPPHDGLCPARKLAALLEDSNSIVAVVEIENEIVGHIYAELIHRTDNAFRHSESTIYIHQIGVRQSKRGQGIGAALMNFIEDRAAAFGASSIIGRSTPARGAFSKRVDICRLRLKCGKR